MRSKPKPLSGIFILIVLMVDYDHIIQFKIILYKPGGRNKKRSGLKTCFRSWLKFQRLCLGEKL